ncbi:transketolase [Haloarcula litorea]|uniref:transketolase n=1 Tax=Haloarcula litorea TaxID=3032579 RepID=UPI0023E87F02|nr:transketolase [Halomicroarcula sp. GDY20]
MSHPELQDEFEEYERQSREVRADVVLTTYAAGSGHPGSSFSSVELLVWLYNETLRVDPAEPDAPGRDRLVFSKGHASPALYAVLSRQGFFERSELFSLREAGELLEGHATDDVPGVEFSSGSLGQGLSFAVGTALGARMDGHDARAIAVLGDGELQEGQVWEAAMSAADRGLDNLVAVVERNGVQNDDLTADTKALGSVAKKFEAFGWHPTECDGHDFASIQRAFEEVTDPTVDGPAVVVADTEKGRGVSFMEETRLGYHSRVLSIEEIVTAFEELDVEHRLSDLKRCQSA